MSISEFHFSFDPKSLSPELNVIQQWQELGVVACSVQYVQSTIKKVSRAALSIFEEDADEAKKRELARLADQKAFDRSTAQLNQSRAQRRALRAKKPEEANRLWNQSPRREITSSRRVQFSPDVEIIEAFKNKK